MLTTVEPASRSASRSTAEERTSPSRQNRPASPGAGIVDRRPAASNLEQLAAVTRQHPAADSPVVQRFVVERRDPRASDKKQVVKAQNDALRAVKFVYVDERGAGAPTQAFAAAAGGATTKAEPAKAIVTPKTDTFVHSFRAHFQTSDWVYEVELIAEAAITQLQWESAAVWDQSLATLIADASGRVRSPFAIISRKERADREGHMNRPYMGPQAWAPSLAFGGYLSVPGPYPPQPVSATALATLMGMDPAQHLRNSPSAAGLVPASPKPAAASRPGAAAAAAGAGSTSASSEPFDFFIPASIKKPWPPPMTEEEFQKAFEARPEAERMSQGGVSHRPAIPRKKGGAARDPGKKMGAPAHSFAPGGKPPPKKGKLATHEWCHIIGDGDGGKCAPENLYIGTSNVNTEQLALELGLRELRGKFRDQGWDIYIRGRVIGDVVEREGGGLLAEQVEYSIYLQQRAGGGAGAPVREEVFTRVMSAQRGALPLLEFTYLQQQVKLLLNSRLGRMLRAARPPSPPLSLGGSFVPREVQSAPWFGMAFPEEVSQAIPGPAYSPLIKPTDSRSRFYIPAVAAAAGPSFHGAGAGLPMPPAKRPATESSKRELEEGSGPVAMDHAPTPPRRASPTPRFAVSKPAPAPLLSPGAGSAAAPLSSLQSLLASHGSTGSHGASAMSPASPFSAAGAGFLSPSAHGGAGFLPPSPLGFAPSAEDDAYDNPILDAALAAVRRLNPGDADYFEEAIVSFDGSVGRLHRRMRAYRKILSAAQYRALKRALDFEA